MNAPSSSVETVKEHATRTGLRNGTDWLKDLLSLSSGADPYIPAAARDAITKRAHFVENGFDFEKMENIARATLARESREIKHRYMTQFMSDIDERNESESE